MVDRYRLHPPKVRFFFEKKRRRKVIYDKNNPKMILQKILGMWAYLLSYLPGTYPKFKLVLFDDIVEILTIL